MEKKLVVKDLVVSFRTQGGKVQAVRDISFNLNKGETLAIVGESGSGKSVTSRAIMGILAVNSIVEGGEIIYDGKDLLKITEDDMHKIRGDKIAMIFQDPMSSLNPIMRVGKQLTEAMLLKNNAMRRGARKNFNSKLKLLLENLNEIASSEEQKKSNEETISVFDRFSVNCAKLEKKFNEILSNAVNLQLKINNFIFLVEKKQKVDIKHSLLKFAQDINETVHPDIVVIDEHLQGLIQIVKNSASETVVSEECLKALKEVSAILEKSTQKDKPNYFALGYYTMKNPDVNVDDMELAELNKMTEAYLEENFLKDFIALGATGLQHSHSKSIALKKELLEASEAVLQFFHQETFSEKDAKEQIVAISKKVDAAIERLAIYKNSAEHAFNESITSAVKRYFFAVKNNPKEVARFNRQTAVRERLVAQGKTPDWTVVPAATLDLELAKKNIRQSLHILRESLRNDIENDLNFNAEDQMNALVDFLHDQASALVYKVTRSMAKAKALKLLEEVGIPEPAIRYRQFPFEFSGGMRQRIVIAIALAANPDILICDEPTTALDVTIQSQILELINRIKEERGLSVIFITHDLGVVANMADRIAVMYAGKIVELGSADDVFYNPRHPYTWALLSSMPDLDTKEKLEAIPGTPPNMIYPPKGDAFAARNKFALEIDFEEEPPMFEVNDGHFAATWLLHPDAPKVDPPKIVTERIARNVGGQKNG